MPIMSRARRGAAILLPLALAACASPHMATGWTAPEPGRARVWGDRGVMIFAMAPSEQVRRQAEEAFSTALAKEGVRGVPSYRAFPRLPPTSAIASEAIVDRVRTAGVDGVVVLHLVDAFARVATIPGGPYYAALGWPSYAARGWTYRPAERPERPEPPQPELRLQADLYAVDSDAVLWAGMSERFHPPTRIDLIREAGRSTAREWKRRGLLGGPPPARPQPPPVPPYTVLPFHGKP